VPIFSIKLLLLFDAALVFSTATTTLLPCRYAFTVHGLWPQRRDGTWPEFCDSSSELDVDEIEDLLPDLEKAWPSWSSDDETFWNHEWTRHGTCAEGIVGHQHAFFQTVLRLHNKLNIQVGRQHRKQPDLSLNWSGVPGVSCDSLSDTACVQQEPRDYVTVASAVGTALRSCKYIQQHHSTVHSSIR
jgi:hypothetical protein